MTAELWERHRADAFAKLETIEVAAAALTGGGLEGRLREDARTAAHKLRGSAAIFGRPRVGELAGELEDRLGPAEVSVPGAEPAVASLVVSLRAAIESDPIPTSPPAGPDRTPSPSLLLVSDSGELRARLEAAAEPRRLDLVVCEPGRAPESLRAAPPDVVLLDLAGADTPQARLDLLAELSADGAAPVIVLADEDGLLDRVEAARRGARAFVGRELEPGAILDAAQSFDRYSTQDPVTVLAVDDDATTLAVLRAQLEPRGFAITTVDDPRRFWEELNTVEPELAILDIDMPEVDGIDLCRAIRSDPRWSGLPILILTAHHDPDLVRLAYATGADDFLSKPIVEEELVRRVRNRLDRVRAYRETG